MEDDVGNMSGDATLVDVPAALLDVDEPGIKTPQRPRTKDDGRAWAVCVAAAFIQVVNVGVLHVFGVFFVEFLEEFNCTKATAAWIGSLAYGLTMAFGILAGVLIKRFGHGLVSSLGSTICALSLLGSSFVTRIELLFITFSVCYGIGCSLSYTPTMCIADEYFDKYVSLATGIMCAGSSTGTLVLTPVTQSLISQFGWRNAMRFLAGVSVLVIGSGFTFRAFRSETVSQRLKMPMTQRIILELQLWKNKVYVVWVAAITLVMFGYYIPYVHLVSHAEDLGIPPATGSVLIMVLGGSTATGRLLFGKIVEIGYLNRLGMHQLSMVVTGTACMIMPLISSFYGLLAYVILVGLVDGCYVVLLPVLTSTWVGDDHRVMAWGFLVGISSVTYTLGPPVAGWIADATGSYNVAFHLAGVPIILGCVVLFLVPWAKKTSTTTNFMYAAKNTFDGLDFDVDDDDDEKQAGGDGDSIFSGPYKKEDDDDDDDAACIVVNLKTGRIEGRTAARDMDVVSDMSKLHDIAHAIEILSRASTSIIDIERSSVRSSQGGASSSVVSVARSPIYPAAFTSCPHTDSRHSVQNAGLQQTAAERHLDDVDGLFRRLRREQHSGHFLSPYPSTTEQEAARRHRQRLLSLHDFTQTARDDPEKPTPPGGAGGGGRTMRRTRYSSVPVDFRDYDEIRSESSKKMSPQIGQLSEHEQGGVAARISGGSEVVHAEPGSRVENVARSTASERQLRLAAAAVDVAPRPVNAGHTKKQLAETTTDKQEKVASVTVETDATTANDGVPPNVTQFPFDVNVTCEQQTGKSKDLSPSECGKGNEAENITACCSSRPSEEMYESVPAENTSTSTGEHAAMKGGAYVCPSDGLCGDTNDNNTAPDDDDDDGDDDDDDGGGGGSEARLAGADTSRLAPRTSKPSLAAARTNERPLPRSSHHLGVGQFILEAKTGSFDGLNRLGKQARGHHGPTDGACARGRRRTGSSLSARDARSPRNDDNDPSTSPSAGVVVVESLHTTDESGRPASRPDTGETVNRQGAPRSVEGATAEGEHGPDEKAASSRREEQSGATDQRTEPRKQLTRV